MGCCSPQSRFSAHGRREEGPAVFPWGCVLPWIPDLPVGGLSTTLHALSNSCDNPALRLLVLALEPTQTCCPTPK